MRQNSRLYASSESRSLNEEPPTFRVRATDILQQVAPPRDDLHALFKVTRIYWYGIYAAMKDVPELRCIPKDSAHTPSKYILA